MHATQYTVYTSQWIRHLMLNNFMMLIKRCYLGRERRKCDDVSESRKNRIID